MKYDIVKLMARRKIRWKKRWVSGDSGGRLTFRSKKAGRLSDYRIYGNTVGGESVGDKTGNLWDENYPDIAVNTVKYISLSVENGEYTISTNMPLSGAASLFLLSGAVISGASTNDNGVWLEHNQTVTVSDNFITIGYRIYSNADPRDYSVMLNFGSTALPYEPYGYKVPVTVSNGTDTLTTPIYLPEPIKMVGDEAEYIDYAEQKMHRVRKNLLNEEYIQGNPISNSIIRVKCKTPIPLVKGELYTISFDSGSLFDVSISSSPTPEYPFASDNTILSYCGNPLNWLTSPYTFECVNDGYISVAIRKKDNTSITPDEVNFAIQFEKNSTATSYEPYIENTDLDVTLPVLPTIKGTNVLSVGTAVQPSEIEVKGKIKAL